MSDLERVLRKLARLLQPPDDERDTSEERPEPSRDTEAPASDRRPPTREMPRPGAATG